jgi:hypothetical protein
MRYLGEQLHFGVVRLFNPLGGQVQKYFHQRMLERCMQPSRGVCPTGMNR